MRDRLPAATTNLRKHKTLPNPNSAFMSNHLITLKLEFSSPYISEARLSTPKYPHHVIDGLDAAGGVTG